MNLTESYKVLPWYHAASLNVYDGSNVYLSSQGATFSNIMSWATDPEGKYEPNYTERGITSAAAAIAHYIMMQYDSSAISTCNYMGVRILFHFEQSVGHGYLVPSGPFLLIVQIILYLIIGITVLQVSYIIYVLQPDMRVEKARRCINDPIRFAFDMVRI